MNDIARLFVGIELSDRARDKISGILPALREGVEGKFHGKSMYHITLCFLGQVQRSDIPAICALIDAIPLPTFALSLGEWGTFKDGKILYLGISEPCETLRAIQHQLAHALIDAGYLSEVAPYVPHITVARGVKRVESLPEAPTAEWTAHKLTLFESARIDERLQYLPIH